MTGNAASPTVGETVCYGFGGARVVELEKLHLLGRPGDVVFFGIDAEILRGFGAPNAGAATFVRDNTMCMMPWTQTCARPSYDIGIVTDKQPEIAQQRAESIARYIASLGCRPVMIGCDHSASLPALTGTLNGGGRTLTYLYFDAHFDLGLHAPTDRLHNGNFVGRILRMEQVSRVINIGGRSWSSFVPVYREVPGFTGIVGGVPPVAAAAVIERLAGLKGGPVYVSIDADVLDPSCAPNVPCQEPFGMTASDLFTICRWIGRSCEVVGADMCEMMPSKQSLGSEQALVRCLHELFPKP